MAVRSANGQSRDKISLCARTGAWGKESPRFGLIFRESCYHILLVAPSRLFPSLASFIPFHLRPLRAVSHFLLSRFSEPSRAPFYLLDPPPVTVDCSLLQSKQVHWIRSFDVHGTRHFCLFTLRRIIRIYILRVNAIHVHIYLRVQVEIESSSFKHRQVLFNFKRCQRHKYRVRTRKREEKITRVDR